jgi:hypothetical protein
VLLATWLRRLSLFTSDAKRLVIRLSIAILKRRYRNVRAAGRERHTPTNQLDWLISRTAMIVESLEGDGTVQVVSAGTSSVSCSEHLLAPHPTASRIGWYDG